MNFLAHAYLSFGDSDTLIGNLIADLVKGKQIESYPNAIRQGIILHREIDAFTDNHPIVRETKNVFNDSVGRYGSSFLDVSYDHFLAINPMYEPNEGWQKFAEGCYNQVESKANILPPKFCSLFMYMRSENWLYNYRNGWMIERSFDRLKIRAKFLTEDAKPFVDFEKNYNQLKESFDNFFPELKEFVIKKI